MKNKKTDGFPESLSDCYFQKEELPVILFGNEKAYKHDDIDFTNKFVKLVDCHSFPPVYTIQSLDGKVQVDRCVPFYYRLATSLELAELNIKY